MDKGALTPLPINLKLTAESREIFDDPGLYRSIVGKLNFLTHTRHVLSYTVHHLSQFLRNPRFQHFQALCRTLRYVSATTGQGIILKGGYQLTLRDLGCLHGY